MGDFLKNLKKQMGVAAQKVGDGATDLKEKSEVYIEVNKRKRKIGQLEDLIERQIISVGRSVYQAYTEKEDLATEYIEDLCREIAEKEDEIEVLEDEIEVIQSKKVLELDCPACGFHNESGAKFCSNCGAKLPEVVQEEPEEEGDIIDTEVETETPVSEDKPEEKKE